MSVLANSRSQILARSSREMTQTVRIDGQYIMSRGRVSVRPSNFLYAKNIQNLGEIGSLARVFILMTQLPAMNSSGTGEKRR